MADPTPTARAHGRSLADFPNLSVAEQKLIACARSGEGCELDPKRPEKPTEANTIHAGLIRFLALGGDDDNPVHEAGVQLWGAWINEELDLTAAIATRRLNIKHTRFVEPILAHNTHLPALYLDGCNIPGLRADGFRIIGGVHLRNGFKATGEVCLSGGQIGDNLDCSGGSFENANGDALSADGAKIAGSVFLTDGFTAKGSVRLVGAQIGGYLYCDDGSFENAGGYALNADRATVTGGFFFRRVTNIKGFVDLTAAHVGSFVDDSASWHENTLILDGFAYDRIAGGPTDAATRIAWLNKQHPRFLNEDFRPQPWEQLVKVLREMGHRRDANEVAIAKQHALRAAGKVGTRKPKTDFPDRWWMPAKAWCWFDVRWNDLSNDFAKGAHYAYGWLAGFGYRPTRIILWAVALWLASAFAFSTAAENGLMAPSNPVLHAHEAGGNVDVTACGANGDVAPARYWVRCAGMPAEYTTFSPLGYAADMILPLVNLQQDSEWGPVVSNAKGPLYWGVVTRWLGWFDILFGWLASLMFVAIVSRLVEKD